MVDIKELILIQEIILTRDPALHAHHQDVCMIASALAKALGLTYKERQIIKHAALSHDIGKLMISDCILHKSTSLSDDEFRTIKIHPAYGASLYARSVKSNSLKRLGIQESTIAEVILQHHERYDGSGYPKGLKGEEISLAAKVLSIADVYSAITTQRPYRHALNHKEAIEKIEKYSGTQFDPDICKVFVKVFVDDNWWNWKLSCPPVEAAQCINDFTGHCYIAQKIATIK